MKILTVVGARPQFIKAATISRALKSHLNIKEVIVHTGQHFDKNMSDVFFEDMDIPKPDYMCDINGLSHGAMTGQMLEKIETIILKEKPDWVLVYGDTNSTLAGALAASKLHIKVAHVEAGLRSFNMQMPEEQNRIITDRISSLLFCPTQTALDNLNTEGYENFQDIEFLNVGDVMFDAASYYKAQSYEKSIFKNIAKNTILVTCHRAENTDSLGRLGSIVKALNQLSKKYNIVFPLHPRTKAALERHSLKLNFETFEPLGYFDMIELLKRSKLVLTDSGGLQKEAYFFETPCLTMRDETEWTELVSAKVNYLVGASDSLICARAHQLLSEEIKFPKELYGDGKAAEKIVSKLLTT